MKKQNAIKLAALVVASLLLSGCWDTGEGEYVGVVTKVARIGGLFQTWEAELHLVDRKGTMIADSVEFSVDEQSHHGENVSALVHALRNAQEDGTRVRILCRREMYVAAWRADTERLCVSIERLP